MNKALNTIGICKCANKISYGEILIKDIKNHSVNIVVICENTSDNSKKKIIDKCNYYKCEYVIAFTQEEIMKVIKDGQLIIINNGVYYNANYRTPKKSFIIVRNGFKS